MTLAGMAYVQVAGQTCSREKVYREPKNKSKTVGVARQQRHFLCGDKENEAKENLARRLACLARYHGNINLEPTADGLSTDPP